MQVIIDEIEENFSIEGKQVSLKEVVTELEDFLFTKGRILSSLKIDGREVSILNFSEEQSVLSESNRIKCFSQTFQEFFLERVRSAKEANRSFSEQIRQLSSQLRAGRNSPEMWQNLKEESKSFFLFWKRFQVYLSSQEEGRESSFCRWMEKMKGQMDSILSAVENRDEGLAADLIDKELFPLLQKADQFLLEMEKNLSPSS